MTWVPIADSICFIESISRAKRWFRTNVAVDSAEPTSVRYSRSEWSALSAPISGTIGMTTASARAMTASDRSSRADPASTTSVSYAVRAVERIRFTWSGPMRRPGSGVPGAARTVSPLSSPTV